MGQLEYGISGDAGTGSFTLDTGAVGNEIAGLFYYDIDIASSQNMSNPDVAQFVRDMVQVGGLPNGHWLAMTRRFRLIGRNHENQHPSCRAAVGIRAGCSETCRRGDHRTSRGIG